MYVRVDNDLVCIDKLIRAEFIPAPYNNNSILSLIYTVEGVDEITTSKFSNISKDSIQILVEAIQNNKDFVDLSKKS